MHICDVVTSGECASDLSLMGSSTLAIVMKSFMRVLPLNEFPAK